MSDHPLTFGITRSKDEADIIESSIRRMLATVDHVIIGDNSTDGTEAILADLVAEGLPITLLRDDAWSWEQRAVMADYAQLALGMGASWGVFFDIDEVFQTTGRISDRLAELPAHILIAQASNTTHCATSLDDPADLDPVSRMGWRSAETLPLGKVACRLRPDLLIGHGNHSASYENEQYPAVVHGVIEARHFPYRSPEQFIKRVKGSWPELKASGLPPGHGAHMRAYGEHLEEFGEEGLTRWFYSGMFFDDPESNPDLVFDPVGPLMEPVEDDDAKAWP